METSAPAWRERIAAFIQSEALPVDKFGHQPRLYALTRLIGEGLPYDDDVVYAAAWLHDLGVFAGHRPSDPVALAAWDNVAYAIRAIPALLANFEFPAKKVAAVIEAVRTHQAHADPQSVEATILRDADILEQLGAVGILRGVSKVGRDTRFATFSSIVPYLRNAAEALPAQLRLLKAKELAEPRLRLLRDFLSAIESEAGGGLY